MADMSHNSFFYSLFSKSYSVYYPLKVKRNYNHVIKSKRPEDRPGVKRRHRA